MKNNCRAGFQKLMTENFMFSFWAITSLVVVFVLASNNQLVDYLSTAAATFFSHTFVFSNINSGFVFDSEIAKAHLLLMVLSIPLQVVTLFLIPSSGIASGVQKKGPQGLWLAIFLFSLLLAVIFTLGPSVSVRYSKVFGENILIAISDWVITIGCSYIVRLLYIVLSK